MNEDRIIIDIPRDIYNVQEIVFCGNAMPVDMNMVSSMSLRITAEEPLPKLDITYLGIPIRGVHMEGN